MVRRFLSPARRALNGVRRRFFGQPDDYLAHCKGIIHVGANLGQERDSYAERGLAVAWIEPIPNIFRRLKQHTIGYRNQIAIEALVTDTDGKDHRLHVASNDGASSSIFDFGKHSDIWPDIRFTHDIEIKSETLPSALKRAGVDPADYDALLIDTQGSELLVLKGAEPLLSGFKYIKAEAADFDSYQGGTTASELVSYLGALGFVVSRSDVLAHHPEGGKYIDLLFKRSSPKRGAFFSSSDYTP